MNHPDIWEGHGAPSPIQPAVGGADLLKTAFAALELAHTFIRDGVEFGYIKDTTKPDWRGTLRETRAAIDALASTSPAQTGGVDQAWLDKAMELADDYAREDAMHDHGRCSMADAQAARDELHTHLSTALGAKGKS